MGGKYLRLAVYCEQFQHMGFGLLLLDSDTICCVSQQVWLTSMIQTPKNTLSFSIEITPERLMTSSTVLKISSFVHFFLNESLSSSYLSGFNVIRNRKPRTHRCMTRAAALSNWNFLCRWFMRLAKNTRCSSCSWRLSFDLVRDSFSLSIVDLFVLRLLVLPVCSWKGSLHTLDFLSKQTRSMVGGIEAIISHGSMINCGSKTDCIWMSGREKRGGTLSPGRRLCCDWLTCMFILVVCLCMWM